MGKPLLPVRGLRDSELLKDTIRHMRPIRKEEKERALSSIDEAI